MRSRGDIQGSRRSEVSRMRAVRLLKWLFLLCTGIVFILMFPLILYQHKKVTVVHLDVFNSQQFVQILQSKNCTKTTPEEVKIHVYPGVTASEIVTRQANKTIAIADVLQKIFHAPYKQKKARESLKMFKNRVKPKNGTPNTTESKRYKYFDVFTSAQFSNLLHSNACIENSTQEDILPPSDNSSLVDLKNFKFLMNHPPCNSEHPPNLLVLVHSAPNNIRKRNQIRKTWGSVLGKNLIFVLGEVDSDYLQEQLEEENFEFNDLVQGSFRDSYRNMTYKHITSLKWAQYYCPGARFVLKTDDDIFINTPALLRELSRADCELKNFILCRVWTNVTVRRGEYKWSVTKEEFQPNVFPKYCSGAAILYSRDAAHALYREAQQARFFWVDDVHVTGVLGKKVNVTHLGVTGKRLPIRVAFNESVFCAKTLFKSPMLFSGHSLTAKEMRILWKYVQTCL